MSIKNRIRKKIESDLDNVTVCYGSAQPDKIFIQSDDMPEDSVKQIMSEFKNWNLILVSDKGENLKTDIAIDSDKAQLVYKLDN